MRIAWGNTIRRMVERRPHTQGGGGIKLTARNRLNAGSIDLGQICGIVEAQPHNARDKWVQTNANGWKNEIDVNKLQEERGRPHEIDVEASHRAENAVFRQATERDENAQNEGDRDDDERQLDGDLESLEKHGQRLPREGHIKSRTFHEPCPSGGNSEEGRLAAAPAWC